MQYRFLLLTLIATAAFSQTAPREFEVASVRPNTANDRIVTINVGPGGRFAARGYTLGLLMQRAYGVMDWNITGGSAWIRTDRYDVVATAAVAGNLTEAHLQPMLQALLADRFKLKLHRVSKEVSGYALTVAKEGPKLKASPDGEEHEDSFRLNQTGMKGQGITMANLARFVGGKLGLIAVDRTGLTGVYDFNVDWPDVTDPDSGVSLSEALRPVVFAALQNRLGLKLVAQKVSVPVLVIDSVQKASEN
ncbi:MAG: TIGR03435 family protein [Acidobacteriota bacterium]|nr:TIGR03435 family protein [Acidobacteriota bacterium]